MTDSDFRQLVRDMRLKQLRIAAIAKGTFNSRWVKGSHMCMDTAKSLENEVLILVAAVDRELGLMPSEV